VCKIAAQLIDHQINATTENHSIQVRFRIDEKHRVPYARSEIRLTEILDEVCGKFDDYGMLGKGPTRRLIKSADIVGSLDSYTSGTTLHRQMKEVCSTIRDDFEEDLLRIYREPAKDYPAEVCVRLTKLCTSEQLATLLEFDRTDVELLKEARLKHEADKAKREAIEAEAKAKREEEDAAKAAAAAATASATADSAAAGDGTANASQDGTASNDGSAVPASDSPASESSQDASTTVKTDL